MVVVCPGIQLKKVRKLHVRTQCGREANRLHDNREPVSRWTSARVTLMAYCREESYGTSRAVTTLQ